MGARIGGVETPKGLEYDESIFSSSNTNIDRLSIFIAAIIQGIAKDCKPSQVPNVSSYVINNTTNIGIGVHPLKI